MTSQPYEVFEHTADIGLYAYGDTLAELFMHTAQGMESLMVAPEQVQVQVSRTISVQGQDRKSTRLNSSHTVISYAVFCLKKKKNRYPCSAARESGVRRKSTTRY